MKEKLKTGILLNNYFIPSWEYKILADIKNSDYAEIVLVIKNEYLLPARGKKRIFSDALIKLVEKADRAIFKKMPDYKLKKDVRGLLQDVHRLEINPENSSVQESFNSREINVIKNLSPDIILKFGCHDVKGDILKIPKYGIWTYSIDNCEDIDSPDTGFREVIRKIPVTNSTLGILTPEKESPEVIFNSWESTCQYSININRDSLSWRSALFAPRILNGLSNHGEYYLNALKNRYISVNNYIERSTSPLSFTEAAGSLFRYIAVVLKSIIKKLFFTDAFRWQLLFDINDGSELYSSRYDSFKKISSPPDVFWADPFVIAADDGYYIFVEEFVYRKNRAHLSVLKLDRQGGLLSAERIIERPYHMSYPYIFKIDSTYYMIPETGKNKTIDLYKCIDFPYKWEFDRNIMENISAVDTTLFHYNNKWWLFTAIDQTANISGSSAELFLFYADSVFSGRWQSHPLNPIVSDIRRARPAGKIFIQDGKILRPSQNCSGRYGVAFNINHVTKLTENEYEETLLTEVKPVWNKKLRGTHTLNFDKDFTVIDVYSFRKRFSI